jgi:hypothetical protein
MTACAVNTFESFAQRFRLRVRRDECGDPIIPGRRGQSQLYFDGGDDGQLSLLVIDGPYVLRSRWKALGARRLWLGDVFQDGKRRVQDVKAEGIPLENAKLAIRLAKVPIRRKLSEAQREALTQRGARTRFQGVKPIAEGSSDPNHRAGTPEAKSRPFSAGRTNEAA